MNDEHVAEQVLEANMGFYLALEQGDLQAMDELWSDDDEVLCAHPGRGPLRGWPEVRQSWAAIFANAGNPQVIVTDAVVTVRHPLAWVTVTENLLAGGHTSVATALNMFEYDGQRWRMVAHHASPLMG
ncbi:MAG: nuclear transport factor 2 family protein [Actinomycetota bacterium]